MTLRLRPRAFNLSGSTWVAVAARTRTRAASVQPQRFAAQHVRQELLCSWCCRSAFRLQATHNRDSTGLTC